MWSPYKGNSQQGLRHTRPQREREEEDVRDEGTRLRMCAIDDGDSRRPRWGHLVNYLRLIYSYVLTLKCSLNLMISKNPSIAILG
jgi:hypothetical protein